MNPQENIREVSRERMIEQIQLIRGGLKKIENGIIENQKQKNAIVIEIDITVSFKFSMLLCCPFNYFRCLSGFLWNLKCAPLYSLAALPDSISPDSIRILKKNLSWTVSGILIFSREVSPFYSQLHSIAECDLAHVSMACMTGRRQSAGAL